MTPPDTMPPPHTVVAAFDFDGTLTWGDTLLPFLRRLLGMPRLLWVLLRCSPWLTGYALRLVSNHRAKARLLQVALRGRSVADVARCAQAFVEEDLPLQWRPSAIAQLLQHQHAGHRCVLISASTSLYMHQVGASLAVDAVLCTEMASSAGHYSGEMSTLNCHGEEKVRRLQTWLAQAGVTPPLELHAYGDTPGDLPMLRMAQHAWYRGARWPKR